MKSPAALLNAFVEGSVWKSDNKYRISNEQLVREWDGTGWINILESVDDTADKEKFQYFTFELTELGQCIIDMGRL